jgi:molybdopterin converting factor subunit 1
MMVKVLLFAQAAEAIGSGALEMALAEGATVADFRRECGERFPQLAAVLPHYFVAVNQDYATNEHTLHDGDEVGVIPPVGGG